MHPPDGFQSLNCLYPFYGLLGKFAICCVIVKLIVPISDNDTIIQIIFYHTTYANSEKSIAYLYIWLPKCRQAHG